MESLWEVILMDSWTNPKTGGNSKPHSSLKGEEISAPFGWPLNAPVVQG